MKSKGTWLKIGLAVLFCLMIVVTVDAAGKRWKIAYLQTGADPYYQRGVEGVQLLAKTLGVDVIVLNADTKPEKELANVEDAITKQVDGIVLFSVSMSSMAGSLDKAKAAGIPVFMIFGYSEKTRDKVVGVIQAPTGVSSKLCGEWIAKNVPEGEIAVITGFPGRGDAEAYTDGFVKAVAANNPKLKVVSVVPGDWNRQKAYTQMQNIITAHPKLVGAFVQNDDMALGAIRALQEAGKMQQVSIVAQNAAPYGVEAVRAGTLKMTVGWSPSQEAMIACKLLVDHLNGKKVPNLVQSPMRIITTKTLNDAVPWDPTQQMVDDLVSGKVPIIVPGHPLWLGEVPAGAK
ncbi:MAG TPA: sugar ABC transporter substrate-binding protein [Spirochaetia bacterium]|nr:sugar ABC transporter substrate-binding protein [Spirochaetia bacterium]